MLPKHIFSSLAAHRFHGAIVGIITSFLLPVMTYAKISPSHAQENTATTITIQDRVEIDIFTANMQITVKVPNGEARPELNNNELICFQDLGNLTEQERDCLRTKVFSDGGQLISEQGYSIDLVVLYEVDKTISTCHNNALLRKKILPINALSCQESSLQQQQLLGINNLVQYGAFATYRLHHEIERRAEATDTELTDDQLARRPYGDGPL